MIRALLLAAIVLGSIPQFAFATVNCDQQFGLDVAACAQSLKTLNPDPRERVHAQKACITDAEAAKVACKSGVNTCGANCESAYTSGVATCQSSYDPNTCPPFSVCESIVVDQLGQCIDEITNTLAVCENGCGLTIVSDCVAACDLTACSQIDRPLACTGVTSVTQHCELLYDPAVCGGIPFCEEKVNFDRTTCIIVANRELLACTTACLP